jgi:hypothetical protein
LKQEIVTSSTWTPSDTVAALLVMRKRRKNAVLSVEAEQRLEIA